MFQGQHRADKRQDKRAPSLEPTTCQETATCLHQSANPITSYIHSLTNPVNHHLLTCTHTHLSVHSSFYQPTQPPICLMTSLFPIHIVTVISDAQSSPTSHHLLSCLPNKTSVYPCITQQGQLAHSPRSTSSLTTHQSQLTHLPRSSYPFTDISSLLATHQSQLILTQPSKREWLQTLPTLR